MIKVKFLGRVRAKNYFRLAQWQGFVLNKIDRSYFRLFEIRRGRYAVGLPCVIEAGMAVVAVRRLPGWRIVPVLLCDGAYRCGG